VLALNAKDDAGTGARFCSDVLRPSPSDGHITVVLAREVEAVAGPSLGGPAVPLSLA
jgi:hypothetical protein